MSCDQALVLAGHGSQRHARSAAPLLAHADRIRASGRFEEVRCAFWKEEPSLRDVATTLESPVAYVVPVLTSEGYFADEVVPRELGVDGVDDPGGRAADVEIEYAEPVGTHSALADVIQERIESAAAGRLADLGVALVGHGTERNERSARATREHVTRLRERGPYAEVGALFLDEPPYVDDLTDHLAAKELVVVPLFVADGYHTSGDIPDAIGHPGIDETATLEGCVVHYTGAVGTEPALAEVIVERAVEAGAEPRSATGADAPAAPGSAGSTAAGPAAGAGEAFLSWVDEAVDGREWGQLRVRRGTDGYELRHHDDVGVPRDDLDAVPDPVSLRDRARSDDRGRYRPLSGARTLPPGWVLGGLDGEALVRAVRFVYPASVASWHRERTGDLTPTDFDGTADRQTGIYADVGDLRGARLAAAVDAVCGTCVRRRRWEATEDDAIDAHRGDGPIPCREACPFFLSAAHAFDVVEPDADAGGDPTVPAGALGAAGNEYRARFARAIARRAGRTPSSARGGGS